jgi:hypothetical protein
MTVSERFITGILKRFDLSKGFDSATSTINCLCPTANDGQPIKTIYYVRDGVYFRFQRMLSKHIRYLMLEQGKNFIIVVVGRVRVGKSWSALRLAENIDENFTADNIVFSAQEFMAIINEKENQIKEGAIILWEEGGVGLNSKNWYSMLNRFTNLILETWGYKHLCLIITVPNFSFIDNSTRKMVNLRINCIERVKDRGVVKAIAEELSIMYKPNGEELKRTSPRLSIRGWTYKMTRLEIRKPSIKLRHAYEIKQLEFKKKLAIELEAQMKQMSNDSQMNLTESKSDDSLFEEFYPILKDFCSWKGENPVIPTYVIMNKVKVNRDRAMFLKKMILDKFRSEEEKPEQIKKEKPNLIDI